MGGLNNHSHPYSYNYLATDSSSITVFVPSCYPSPPQVQSMTSYGEKCLKARKILVCSTAVLLLWHAMLLPTNSSSYKVWIEIKYDLQIACFHATVSTVLSFTQRVPIKPYCKLGLNNFRKIGTEIRLDNMQTECGSILSSHFWGGALGDHTKNGFGAY